MRDAVGLGDLFLAYQPIHDPRGKIVRVEAYVRCRMPDGSTAGGDVLIPLVLRAGLLAKLDLWVLYSGAAEAMKWPDAGGGAPRLAVNMSAAIGLSDVFGETIVEVALSTGLQLSRLSVDIEDRS